MAEIQIWKPVTNNPLQTRYELSSVEASIVVDNREKYSLNPLYQIGPTYSPTLECVCMAQRIKELSVNEQTRQAMLAEVIQLVQIRYMRHVGHPLDPNLVARMRDYYKLTNRLN